MRNRLSLTGRHRKLNYAGADLRQSEVFIHHATLVGADFSNVRFGVGGLGGGVNFSVFKRCKLDGVDFGDLVFGQVRFEKCSLEAVKWTRVLKTVEFVDCVLSGEAVDGTWWGKTLSGLPSRRNQMEGNDLTRLSMYDFNFLDLPLGRNRLPPKEVAVRLPEVRRTVQEATQEVAGWEPGGLREEVDGFLRTLARSTRQSDTLLLSRSVSMMLPDAQAAVMDLLERHA